MHDAVHTAGPGMAHAGDQELRHLQKCVHTVRVLARVHTRGRPLVLSGLHQ